VRLKCALFDVDGTLTDTTNLIAEGLMGTIEEAMNYRPPREEIVALIGRPLKDQLALYIEDARIPSFSDRFMTYYEERRAEMESLFPGALEMLQEARRLGYVTGLVTSKNRREIDGTLELHPIGEYLDFVVSSEDSPRPKPFPDPALEALRRANAAPQETIFIGDSVYDLRCGAAAGVRTGAALWGPFGRPVLEPENPDFLFQTPEEATVLLRLAAPSGPN
jgi:pyrophosphatase PpaX